MDFGPAERALVDQLCVDVGFVRDQDTANTEVRSTSTLVHNVQFQVVKYSVRENKSLINEYFL